MRIDREHVHFQLRQSPAPILHLVGKRDHKGPKSRIFRTPLYYLFHYILEGSGTVLTPENQLEEVTAGDWFFAFPDCCLGYEQHPHDPWRYTWVGFSGNRISDVLAEAGIGPQTYIRRADPDPAVTQLFDRMFACMSTPGPSSHSHLLGNMYLAQLLAYLRESAPEIPPITDQRQETRADEAIERACTFMINHFTEGINAQDVARHVDLERTYFSKIFAKHTGTTVRDYLAALRLNRAKELLQQSTQTIETIAQSTGFSEARSFARFFKQQTGQPPSAYRTD